MKIEWKEEKEDLGDLGTRPWYHGLVGTRYEIHITQHNYREWAVFDNKLGNKVGAILFGTAFSLSGAMMSAEESLEEHVRKEVLELSSLLAD